MELFDKNGTSQTTPKDEKGKYKYQWKANQVCGEIRRQKCNCNGKCSVDELRKQIFIYYGD
jgi:hypothetical protein